MSSHSAIKLPSTPPLIERKAHTDVGMVPENSVSWIVHVRSRLKLPIPSGRVPLNKLAVTTKIKDSKVLSMTHGRQQ